MNRMRALFVKQALDMIRNKVVLIQFIVFPIVAVVFTQWVAKVSDTITDSMFVTLFAALFVGYTLVTTTAGIIAEDRERKSLRLLVMAGVKPFEYFLGICGVILIVSLLASFVFGIMGGFTGMVFVKFASVMMLGSIASMLLGATVGILSDNQQAAHAVSMTIAMIIGFGPMITMFNTTAAKILSVLYTQQFNIIANDSTASFTKTLSVIGANITVLAVLFMFAYRIKGFKLKER
jgi:ABC-2 type transport system permease protein